MEEKCLFLQIFIINQRPLENPRTLKLKRPISAHKFRITSADSNDREYFRARIFARNCLRATHESL